MVMTFGSCIYLKNIRLHAYHGVLEQERIVGNDYVINAEIDYDFSCAMQTDDLRHTISYAEVYDLIVEEMAVPSRLLEHVVGRIGERLFQTYPSVHELTLSITKVNPPMGGDCDGAGVQVHLINDKTECQS